jgi:hypothetical protein
VSLTSHLQDAGELIQRIGRMFYIVNPWNHMFPDNDFDSVRSVD